MNLEGLSQKIKLTQCEILEIIRVHNIKVPKFVNGNMRFPEKIVEQIDSLYWRGKPAYKKRKRKALAKRVVISKIIQIDSPNPLLINGVDYELKLARTKAILHNRINRRFKGPVTPRKTNTTLWYPRKTLKIS